MLKTENSLDNKLKIQISQIITKIQNHNILNQRMILVYLVKLFRY